MFGLSHHKGLLLLPHLCLSVGEKLLLHDVALRHTDYIALLQVIICCFHAVLTIQWLVSCAETGQPIDGDWLMYVCCNAGWVAGASFPKTMLTKIWVLCPLDVKAYLCMVCIL